MGSIFMVKNGFTAEEKINVIALHIHDGMGYRAISNGYGVPIATLRLWIRKYPPLIMKFYQTPYQICA